MKAASEDLYSKMDRLIDRVDRLHSSPHVACQVLALLQDEDFDMRELVHCLEADPALATSILRLVNSSYFGVSRDVASLQQAVTFLGSRSLRLAVLSFGLLKHLNRDTPADVYHAFWQRSLTMASACSLLSKPRGEWRDDEAYSAGLLADVGMLVLAQEETDEFVRLFTEHGHTRELLDAELTVWGFNHAQLGGRLLTRWNLPESLTGAVSEYCERPADETTLQFLVWTSDLVADALWTPGTRRAVEAREVLDRSYSIDLDGYINLAIECKRLIAENAEMFRIDLGQTIDCDRILECARQQYMETALEAALDLDSVSWGF